MNKIKIGIIGASGYAGAELLRLLLNHPNAEVVGIYSRSFTSKTISDVYPSFFNISHLVFEDVDTLILKSDVVFASLPHGLSETYARACVNKEKKFIDLGADFRLYDEKDYQDWYKLNYEDSELHKLAVYGLSELNRKQIKSASIVGNPGCYPTSVALALFPLIEKGLLKTNHLIIDAKSGTTGAGKEPSEGTHFARVNESFGPYKVAEHRHTPEIEQTLKELSNKDIKLTFVPHLLPINRGIVSTIYVQMDQAYSEEELHSIYTTLYKDEQFVRVLDLGKTSDLKFVVYSNYCDISIHFDKRTNTLVLVSAIDNMIKGAAGQAIQNMNIMYDLEENVGLNYIPPSF